MSEGRKIIHAWKLGESIVPGDGAETLEARIDAALVAAKVCGAEKAIEKCIAAAQREACEETNGPAYCADDCACAATVGERIAERIRSLSPAAVVAEEERLGVTSTERGEHGGANPHPSVPAVPSPCPTCRVVHPAEHSCTPATDDAPVPCLTCDGSGRVPSNGHRHAATVVPCPACKGARP